MAQMIGRICKHKACGAAFEARVADVKRGWALYCSKSCKARAKPLGRGQRDYLRVAVPQPKALPVINTRLARAESMYELGTTEVAKWDDSAWLANG
jgi:hypothetical protein